MNGFVNVPDFATVALVSCVFKWAWVGEPPSITAWSTETKIKRNMTSFSQSFHNTESETKRVEGEQRVDGIVYQQQQQQYFIYPRDT